MSQEYNATVVKIDFLSDKLCLLAAKPDFEINQFRSGQFTTLGLKLEKEGHNPYNSKNYYPFDDTEFTFGDESNRLLMEIKKKYKITEKRNLELQSSIQKLERKLKMNKEMCLKIIINHICSVKFATALIKKSS